MRDEGPCVYKKIIKWNITSAAKLFALTKILFSKQIFEKRWTSTDSKASLATKTVVYSRKNYSCSSRLGLEYIFFFIQQAVGCGRLLQSYILFRYILRCLGRWQMPNLYIKPARQQSYTHTVVHRTALPSGSQAFDATKYRFFISLCHAIQENSPNSIFNPRWQKKAKQHRPQQVPLILKFLNVNY